jgi:RHS repeat-associated protein
MRTAGSADLAIYLPDSDLSVNTSTGKTIWNTYFMAGGQRVGSDTGTQTSSGITLTTEYFENDYQNSIGLVTADNFSGANPKVNQGFDAFGHPRSVTGTDTTPWPTTTPPRGYINQVMLPAEEIVDLNARYYDPALGRFLAPDPVISDMDDSQAWNAYTYSDNNPMSKYPTGAEPDEDPFCQGSCGQGTPPGMSLGGGISYHAQHNALYVPAGTSKSVANAIAGAIQGGGLQGAAAGASKTSSLMVSPGLSGHYHEGKTGAPSGLLAANTTAGKVVQGVGNRID